MAAELTKTLSAGEHLVPVVEEVQGRWKRNATSCGWAAAAVAASSVVELLSGSLWW
jgi:hypothetical protein